MKLVRLGVQRFQCIEAADVELGPHLNVLYGPNDLGKSSLAWAIRAVLLLQHNSSHAERFSSWYGDREPHVALTMRHDDGRYWRVTKQFGGSSGRSALESSKDGRTFTSEASAREVDKRVRELLRWGLAAPGGQGRQAFPDSFLTQVLLADQAQDSVRKILFEPRLDKDPDESGRARLIEALGALAQDPLFKQVVDQATARVDEAFTPKGMRKRAAGSPWVEIGERITRLRREQEACQQAVKDSEGVEARIKALHGQREAVRARVDEAMTILATGRARLAEQQERDRLLAEIAECEQELRDVEEAARQLDTSGRQAQELERQASAAAEAERAALRALGEQETRRDGLRARLDAALADPEAAQRQAMLAASLRAAEEGIRDAQAALDAADGALTSAAATARRLAAASLDASTTTDHATRVEHATAEAARVVDDAQRVLEAARDEQRTARSGEQAQARALRRQELANRRLSIDARRGAIEASLQRARQVGERTAAREAAKGEHQRAHVSVEAARLAVERSAAAADEVDRRRRTLAQVDAYGRYRALRDEVAQARRAAEDAERERGRAAGLRQEADGLRADVRANVPARERLAALRALRDELRLAEARLGGGLSVVLRPRRSLTVRTARDGAAVTAATTAEPLVVEAARSLTLQLDELVDIEITAGEERARARATELRTRWLREGEAALIEHGATSLEELEGARARSDEAERRIAQLVADATVAEQRAAAAVIHDLAALQARLAAAEAELGASDREELATRLARLGDPWQTGLRKQAAELDAALEAEQRRCAADREELARLIARAEAQEQLVRSLAAELEVADSALGLPWATVVATSQAELADVAAEVADVDAQVALLASGESSSEGAAERAVRDALAALEAAKTGQACAQTEAEAARAAQIRASTVLDAAFAAARDLDVDGWWAGALATASMELPLDGWRARKHDAARRLEAARATRVAAERALAEDQEASARAVRRLREDVEQAERDARDARARADAAATTREQLVARHHAAVVLHAEQKLAIASVDLDETRREIADLRVRVRELGPASGRVDEGALLALADAAQREVDTLQGIDEELARARGALEQVGGAIARERLHEITKALDDAREREREIEIEYEAWRLLKQTLQASESSESAHLGRALAGPVAERFRALTGGRYGAIELGAQLEPGGVQVAGELRDIEALSAGTQDQLATLLRVCIAEQLHSTIVLDDHLSQSDVGRLAWFNGMLRDAAQHMQIVLITCRPQELLTDDERPAARQSVRDTPRVRAIDLSRVIQRYGAAPTPRRSAR